LSEEQVASQYRNAINVDPTRVPEELRGLVPLALKWGIGDDSSRHYFVERASAKDKRLLKKALTSLADATSAWLDTFADGEFDDEATAFLYLLEAAEELLN
jgi:hypothetical protein